MRKSNNIVEGRNGKKEKKREKKKNKEKNRRKERRVPDQGSKRTEKQKNNFARTKK